jgi:hypothetical protein
LCLEKEKNFAICVDGRGGQCDSFGMEATTATATIETIMKIYTYVAIYPHHAGFGMYERGEVHCGQETSYAHPSDLLKVVAQNSDYVLAIEEAVSDPDFIAAEVEDVRGKIYNQPPAIFACLDRGELSYFGIVENEVSDDFFGE